MIVRDKRILNLLIIISLTIVTFLWTFWVFHWDIRWDVIGVVILVRMLASMLIFKDYSLSWSKVTQKTFILKSIVYGSAFCVYALVYYKEVFLYFMLSELFFYLFAINFSMYMYYLFINRSRTQKDKTLVIYGAGKAGGRLEEEFRPLSYDMKFFIDDDKKLQKRSVDGLRILSKEEAKKVIGKTPYDLLVIAMPSANPSNVKVIYHELKPFFKSVKVLPSLNSILDNTFLSDRLKNITVEDLLARHPQDLDKEAIAQFIKNKVVMITGAGGSIGSELVKQCLRYEATHILALDHNEFALYQLLEENSDARLRPFLQNVLDKVTLETIFKEYQPHIVIHAAAYKHVPLVEQDCERGVINNILGTKQCIDLSIAYGVEKVILISTDKAVRPTSVMGATKRVCELYAQNVEMNETIIISVRFGNVLGSSGSVIPKFKAQIEKGGPVTVTHPDMTRYFMLISEACELVLQAGAIGNKGELYILDMGKPVKIMDLAKRMIELSGKENIDIVFCGMREGEKLYEELLIEETNQKTQYDSIFLGDKTAYPIEQLCKDIEQLIVSHDKRAMLQCIVPEFTYKK